MSTAPAHTYQCRSEQETAALAQKLASAICGGSYISLEGDLGAGKTLFVRAFISAFGITENVTSPTFVLQKYYRLPVPVNGITQVAHYDFYRISDYNELLDLGFEDHASDTVVLAEWGDMFIKDFPQQPIRVRFAIQPNNVRLIELHNLILQ